MKILLLGLVVIVLTGCSSNRQFSNGTYDDPREVKLLNDQFNEADIHRFSQSMVAELSSCKRTKPNSTVIWGGLKNSTSEHLDTEMISDVITSSLTNQYYFTFINKPAREELGNEYQYEKESGYVREPAEVKQISSDYLLTGNIDSNIQEVGLKKLTYYQMTVNLTETRTNRIVCSHTEMLRKDFKKNVVNE